MQHTGTVLNIMERRVHDPEELETVPIKRVRRRELVREVPPVREAPRRVQDTGTRASYKRMLSREVEAAREDTPQNVSFEYSVSNW